MQQKLSRKLNRRYFHNSVSWALNSITVFAVVFCFSGNIVIAQQKLAEKEPAVIQLDEQTRSRCLEVLRQGIKSDEFWPSIHAAEALTLAGYGEAVTRFLAPKLPGEKDDQHRCGLARELVRAGDRSKAAVMFGILAGEDTFGHIHAAESLYKVAEVNDGRLLRKAMQQEANPILQLMAAGALGRCGDPVSMALLRSKLQESDPDNARIAAWLLGRIGDATDIPALRAGADRFDDPLVRAYFINALATLGEKAATQELLKNLSSDDPAIKTYAAVFASDGRILAAAKGLKKLLDAETLDVRIRAAQSLLVLALPGQDRHAVIVNDVYPATAKNPRYSEGSVLALRDGSLLYAVTEFVGQESDFSKASIIARHSTDGGKTWGQPRTLQENIGKLNVMSVTIRRLKPKAQADGPIGLFYLIKNGFNDLNLYLRISKDDAKSFGEPILISKHPGYHTMNNDRITVLSTGRILAPLASTPDIHKVNHLVSYCMISDDGGKNWRRGKGQVDQPKRGAMEPEVLELNDGRLLMIVRNQLGSIAASYSKDGGDTWSKPFDWGVKAPEAPSTLRRIPASGDLLLVWNHTFTGGAGHGGKRTPLTAAVSSDEGKTWRLHKNLETRTDQTYAYTSIAFLKGRAVLTYYVRDEKSGHISSRFRSLPVSWFYGEEKAK